MKVEYSALREELRALAGRADTARTFGVAAIGAVLTLAVQQGLAVLALAAVVLVYCFARIDLVNAFRYTRFAQRAKRVELALDAYEECERLPDDKTAKEALSKRLLGLVGKRPYQEELNEPGPNELAFVHPHSVFKFLYPVLLVGSAAVACMIESRHGSTKEIVAVICAALFLTALWLPRFADPTNPPLAWWRGKGATRARRRAAWGIPFAVAALLALAASWALPALRTPEVQQSGSISLSLSGRHGPLAVELVLSPSCSGSSGALRVQWTGPPGRLLVLLPENLETRDGRRHLSIPVQNSPAEIPLLAHSGEVLEARCTLALPALVGSGETRLGVSRLRLPRGFGGFSLDGLAARNMAQLGPCRADAGRSPLAKCAGVVHLVEAGSSDRRLRNLALAGGAVLLAALLVAGFLAMGFVRRGARGRDLRDRGG